MEWELFLAVLVGCILNLLFSLNEIYGKPEFKWVIFLKQNTIPTIINLMCGFILVWFKEDIVNIFPVGGLSAIFIGIGGQTLFKKVQNIFDKSVNTYVGV